jgi:hypothetical protein
MWYYLDQYRPVRVTPLGAVYRALDSYLQSPGKGLDPRQAHDTVMDLAGKFGVETSRPDPYDLMVHYAHLAEVLARVVRQPETDPFTKVGTYKFYDPDSWLVAGGTRIMRLVIVDRWSDNRLQAELHGWRTIGDVCVTGLPMTLRVLVIGEQVNGRRHGYWTKAKQHPYTKQLRWKRTRGDQELGESWKTVWREQSQVSADKWIEGMARDGVLRESAFEVKVKVPEQYQRDRVLEDITRISDEMQALRAGKVTPPMTRSACDAVIGGPCRLQCVCYAPTEIRLDETGMFERRKRGNQNRQQQSAVD